MAIEKMTFIDMKGSADHLDEVLIRCARCGLFQPENAAKLSEYSIGTATLLRNPYGGLQVKINEMALHLGIPLDYRKGSTEAQPNPDGFISDVNLYLNNMRGEYPRYFEQQQKVNDEIVSYTTALDMLRHIDAPDINFDKLWENKFLKIRFGRLPTLNLAKLSVYEDKPYELYRLESSMGYTWCLYVTAGEYRDDIDQMFHTLNFERLRIPDYVHGTANDAISFIQDGLNEEREKLEEAREKIAAFVKRERDAFLDLYSRVKFLHDAYDLRKYAVIIRNQFHVVGFVLTHDKDAFLAQFEGVPTVDILVEAADAEGPIAVPVKLRNNWFVRPFEMFVNMYGSPSYNDIDPSPFVAYTYSLLFGMMFGDFGHGLCVSLLGLFLWHKKRLQLGAIMSRVGVASMFFGFCYGSVFGFEHLLDPVFRLMGFAEKPIEIMKPSTTNMILIAAIAIGAVVILMVILFNILIGIHHRDFDRVVLSHNGLAGLVFYGSVLFAAVSTLLGHSVVNTAYILLLIVLPLVLIFFREPITRYMRYRSQDTIIHSDADLEQTKKFQEGGVNIPELFTTQFVTARFGRIPTDSYRKLTFYQNEPFMIYPLKTDREYIWCIYATAVASKEEIDAIFRDLYFERIFIPDAELATTELAEAFIKRCVDAGSTITETISNDKYGQVTIQKPKTVFQTMFPEGFGGFFLQTFFELFEVVLSFVTNTMSFLRVGGFILVHAGMMEVVFKMSEMVGSGTGPLVIIFGNVFVMCMEGLIVGIQVLRLEFYEIFSRFFDAAGEPFTPYVVQYGQSAGK